MSRKCWAASLGNCSKRLSKEHLITEKVLRDGKLTVSGSKWSGETKSITRGGFVGRILCGHHNSELSRIDEKGIDFVSTLEKAVELSNNRELLPKPNNWYWKKFVIDGNGTEKWFSKTIINLQIAHGNSLFRWRFDDFRAEPSPQIVNTIFGIDRLLPPKGLYFQMVVGEKVDSIKDFSYVEYENNQNEFIGGELSIKGFRFIVWFLDSHSPASHPLQPNSLIYRPDAIKFEVKGKYSHKLAFSWK